MTQLSTPHSGLVIDSKPTNLRLPPELGSAFVDSDMFGICERLKAYDPNLSVILLDGANFAIVETDSNGVENLVFRVGPGCEIDALDGRVFAKLNYIRSVPADVRLREMEAEIAREREAMIEERKEKMWENMGAPLYSNLARLGFIDTPRTESLRPQNRAARRAGRRMK